MIVNVCKTSQILDDHTNVSIGVSNVQFLM